MLTHLQKKKLTKLFKVDDEENRGYVDRGTYVQIVNRFAIKLGWTLNSKEYQSLYSKWMLFWDTMVKYGDTDKDNHLTLEEFFTGFDYIINHMDDGYYKILTHVPYLLFKIYDTNADGVISLKEYTEFMHMIRSDLGDKEIEDLFTKTDVDGNQVITQEEFDTVVHQFFYSEDAKEPGNYLFGTI